MSLTGVIAGNSIRLDRTTDLADGTRVRVVVEALDRADPTPEERVAIVERTRGLMRATKEQVRLAIEADPYGV